MKFIKKIIESQEKHFLEGGKLQKLYPIFEATKTLFFLPSPSCENSPFIRDFLELKRFMSFVIIALIPILLFGIYNTGYQIHFFNGAPLDFTSVYITGLKRVIPLLIVSYSVGLFWEGVFASIRKHNISEGFLVTGMLFPLILPPTIPLWQAAVGISFGVVIGKEVFGGTGRNFLNPALTARAFLFFSYPVKMSGDSVWIGGNNLKPVVDGMTSATPLSISSLVSPTENIHTIIENSGYTINKLFMGLYPGSIGETSVLLCIIGALFLTITGIASYKIILGGVLGVLLTGVLLNFTGSSANPFTQINPFYHLLMGGFVFGITFMATDPVSAPGTEFSKWIYGFLIGGLTVIIRVFNPAYPEGTMLAILFMNVFAPLLDYFEIKLRISKRIRNV